MLEDSRTPSEGRQKRVVPDPVPTNTFAHALPYALGVSCLLMTSSDRFSWEDFIVTMKFESLWLAAHCCRQAVVDAHGLAA